MGGVLMPALIPQQLEDISTTDYADATDLTTAIALLNKLKKYTLEDVASIRSQLNLLIQVVDDLSQRLEP
jgi:hypothetical protein